jgi:hypothetical protein
MMPFCILRGEGAGSMHKLQYGENLSIFTEKKKDLNLLLATLLLHSQMMQAMKKEEK